MKETKTYILGWNRVSQKCITYSNTDHAKMSGTWYLEIEATSHREAVEEFMERYQENHSEME
jgi:hypothetical protein